jgi:hypothetical protein
MSPRLVVKLNAAGGIKASGGKSSHSGSSVSRSAARRANRVEDLSQHGGDEQAPDPIVRSRSTGCRPDGLRISSETEFRATNVLAKSPRGRVDPVA